METSGAYGTTGRRRIRPSADPLAGASGLRAAGLRPIEVFDPVAGTIAAIAAAPSAVLTTAATQTHSAMQKVMNSPLLRELQDPYLPGRQPHVVPRPSPWVHGEWTSALGARPRRVGPSKIADQRWLRPTIDQLVRLALLPRRWDTYDALPMDRQQMLVALNFLIRFLGADAPAPAVVALANGGLQFEWHTNGLDVELTFEPAPDHGPMLYAFDQSTGGEWEGVADAGFQELDVSRRLTEATSPA